MSDQVELDRDEATRALDSASLARRYADEGKFLFWVVVVFWLFVYAPAWPFEGIIGFIFTTLTAVTPSAMKIGLRLGLPGAPYIAEWRFQGPHRISLREIFKSGVVWGLAALLVTLVVSTATVLPEIFLFHGFGAHSGAAPHAIQAMPSSASVALRFASRVVAAIGAGVIEEILFRGTLMAVILPLVMKFVAASAESLPSPRAIWIATIAQAYLFALSHLHQLNANLAARHIAWPLVPLFMPQLFVGIILGRLYLRKGLETSAVAHITIDLALSVFALAWLLTGHSSRLLFAN